MMFSRWWLQSCFIWLIWKNIFAKNILRSKNFKKKLRNLVVETEAIQKCRFHIHACNKTKISEWIIIYR